RLFQPERLGLLAVVGIIHADAEEFFWVRNGSMEAHLRQRDGASIRNGDGLEALARGRAGREKSLHAARQFRRRFGKVDDLIAKDLAQPLLAAGHGKYS